MHDGKTAFLLARCLKVLCFDLKVILADAGYRGEVAAKIKKNSDMCLKSLQAETRQVKKEPQPVLKKAYLLFSYLKINPYLCKRSYMQPNASRLSKGEGRHGDVLLLS